MAEAVMVGGETNVSYAGGGYEPLLDSSYSTALRAENVLISNHVGNDALDADLRVIINQSTLDDFVSRSRQYGVNLEVADKYKESFEQFGGGPVLNASTKKKIMDRMVVEDSVVTAIARITVRHMRGDVGDRPSLTAEAQSLLDQGDASAFFDAYGTTYVSTGIWGGEAYYLYSFDFAKTNNISQSERESSIRAYLGTLYEYEQTGNTPRQEASELENIIVSRSAVSTIPGYEPGYVETVEDFDQEKVRIQEYLLAHPQHAVPVDRSIRSYASLTGNEALQTEFDRRMECFGDYYQWQVMADNLAYANRFTTMTRLKSETELALETARQQIRNAVSCRETSGSPSVYQPLLELWKVEQQTVPLYRFYSAERTNSYYTTNPETVKNIDGADSYSLVKDVNGDGINDNEHGIMCRILAKEDPGTTWIEESWHNLNDDHRYNTRLFNRLLSGYLYERELGYIYENNGVNDIDDQYLRPLSLFYNDEVKDHLMTVDPQQEAFGSPDGGDGYQPMGTLGFAIVQE